MQARTMIALSVVTGSRSVVAAIDVRDLAPYDKEYVPGAPRIAIMRFDCMEQAKAAFASPACRAAKKVGDKYANFHVYVVEGCRNSAPSGRGCRWPSAAAPGDPSP